jgi:hypothetical protein
MCLAGIVGASPDYVVLKMSPESNQVINGEPVESMSGTDMKYSQVKLK